MWELRSPLLGPLFGLSGSNPPAISHGRILVILNHLVIADPMEIDHVVVVWVVLLEENFLEARILINPLIYIIIFIYILDPLHISKISISYV